MAIKWKNNKETTMTEEITLEKETKKNKTWIGYLLICVLVAAVTLVTCRMEPEVQKIREKSKKEQKIWEEQNMVTEVDLGYYSDRDKMSLISNIYYLNYKMENMYDGLSSSEYLLKNNKSYKALTNVEEKQQYEEKAKQLVDILYTVYRMDFSVGEDCNTYTYMYDKKRGISSGQGDLADVLQGRDLQEVQEKYQSYLVLDFDEKGRISITDKYNVDEGNFLNYLNNIKLQAVADYFAGQDMYIYEAEVSEDKYDYDYNDTLEDVVEVEEEVEPIEGGYTLDDFETNITENSMQEAETKKIVIDFPKIKNTQVVIGFRYVFNTYPEVRCDAAYKFSYVIVVCAMIALFVGALVLQNISYLGLKKQTIFSMPTELVGLVGFLGLLVTVDWEIPYQMLLYAREAFEDWIMDGNIVVKEAVLTRHIPTVLYLGWWIGYYGIVYWGIANVLPYLLHPIQNIREKSIIVKICRWLLRQCRRCWNYVTTIQLEKGLKSNIIKVLVVNFLVASLFCCGWFMGIFGVAVYTIILYFVLVKKGGALQRQYQRLLSMVSDMAQGELNAEVSEDLGVFEPVKQELTKVREGFKRAVEEEVKSQNMKTELITNVSHDLKTPLTAIITYVDLLKNENLEEETRKEYIMTLDKKSQRLKVLIEDLFEVSKASSNNIVMHYADVDLVNLVKQVRLENEERIMDSDLIFRWNLPEEKCVLRLDPQRTYRIIENLLINALKYSMSGSRVYVDVIREGETVMFTMKNISAMELNFEAEQLTERFVRGDVSRNTEGSGLGLAIARSFTEIQNGKFTVDIDGDLFKVVVAFNQ